MYKCQMCGTLQESGKKQNKKVVEVREKQYANGGQGKEIVKELNVCDQCK